MLCVLLLRPQLVPCCAIRISTKRAFSPQADQKHPCRRTRAQLRAPCTKAWAATSGCRHVGPAASSQYQRHLADRVPPWRSTIGSSVADLLLAQQMVEAPVQAHWKLGLSSQLLTRREQKRRPGRQTLPPPELLLPLSEQPSSPLGTLPPSQTCKIPLVPRSPPPSPPVRRRADCRSP